MRDLKELQPPESAFSSASKPGRGGQGQPSKDATARLLAELQLIKKSNAKESGYSVAPVKRNMFVWEVQLFGFEGPLAADMKRYKIDAVVRFAIGISHLDKIS